MSYTDKGLVFRWVQIVLLVADLVLFCYSIDCMTSISDVNQADSIEAINLTSRYLDDLFDFDNPYFEGMVN